MVVRVYVGGLPLDIDSVELRERFGRFVSNAKDCRLTDVVLPKAKPIGTFVPPLGTTRGFAYLTLEGAAAKMQSEKLQLTFNRTKWRGSLLKVQLAKPSFREKLQREWEEAHKKKKQAEYRLGDQQPVSFGEVQPLNVSVRFRGKKTTQFLDVDEQVTSTESETMSDVDDTDEEVEADETMENGTDEILEEDDVEAFVRQMEEAAELEQKPLTKEEVNARRLAALKAKQQRKEKDMPMIIAPRTGEALNKRITFDDSGNEFEAEEEVEKSGVISNWMDSSDDEADGDECQGSRTLDLMGKEEADTAVDMETQAAFALRPEFMGEKGKKLFELQKGFGGDSRFRLDARFLEQEADEFGGNEVDEEEDGEDANVELQRFLKEEIGDTATHYAREMHEEEMASLRVVSKLFPDVDVTRLQRRLHEQRAPKEPLKQAAWMGELKRYDPRDVHACREFELSMTTSSKQAEKEGEATARRQRVEKEVLTGGDRYFSTSGALSSLFSRVRTNSEDGEEGEAALDGVAGAPPTNSDASFKLGSLFSLPVGEDQSLAAIGEQLFEDGDTGATSSAEKWVSSQGYDDPVDETMGTDSEGGDEAEDDQEKVQETSKRVKKSLEDFVAFGRTFVGTGEDVVDWPERRKKLTLDYKRKRRDAVKMKKRSNKFQQTNATGVRENSKWKKTKL